MRIVIRRLMILMGVSLVLITHPATADPWYEHYANAEQAIEDSDWATAVVEINEALARKGDSVARARSYGMNVTAYFPYFKLGIAYYHLGQLDAALQAFETEAQLGAIAQSDSANAELERYRGLAEEAQALAAAEEQQRIRQIVERSLIAARDFEDQGLLDEAMAALDQALAVAPDDVEAQDAMSRLRQQFRDQEIQALLDEAQGELSAELGARDELEDEPQSIDADAEAERALQARIVQLLADAETLFATGETEEALSAANRVLALDPGNNTALSHVAQAYSAISQQLLGTGPQGNIPPAVRFVDLRQEDEDGTLLETIDAPDFRLNGVVIDNSPVTVVFYDNDDRVLETKLNEQPLGDFYLTEFSVELTLPPGRSTFRLEATDAENLSSGSEYAVMYARPFFRAPWFYALAIGAIAAMLAFFMWQRYRRGQQLRKRRFNPYVAGAPVIEEDMFFGRRELVDRILQTIHNNSLLLYGERRIGKTSIQHQLKKRLRGLDDPLYEFHPVFVDLQGTPETRFFQTIAEDIFQELAPVLGGLQPGTETSGEYSYRDFIRDVRAVLKTLEERTLKKVRLVLLIDEVDELNDYDPRVNQRLRSLFMKSFAESLVAVVSGVEIKKQWEREGSPWYNFFEEIEVKPFGPQEAQELIERPIGSMFKLDDGVVERIISLTDGKPYLIQKICISLVTRLHEQRRRRITIADVDAVSFPEAA